MTIHRDFRSKPAVFEGCTTSFWFRPDLGRLGFVTADSLVLDGRWSLDNSYCQDMPPPHSDSIPALEERRASILASINSIGALRPGSVSEVYTKCGRTTCHCHRYGDPGHGPYFRLTFNSDGKQITRSLPARQADAVREEVAECQRLRRLTAELIEVSEQISEARIHSIGTNPAMDAAREKPASRSSSPPSMPKSPAS